MSKKQRLRSERIAMLVNCAAAEGVEVRKFSDHHYRIMGKNLVDYWPGTSKAWILGAQSQGKVMTPQEAYALSYHAELLPEGAEDHLKNI